MKINICGQDFESKGITARTIDDIGKELGKNFDSVDIIGNIPFDIVPYSTGAYGDATLEKYNKDDETLRICRRWRKHTSWSTWYRQTHRDDVAIFVNGYYPNAAIVVGSYEKVRGY